MVVTANVSFVVQGFQLYYNRTGPGQTLITQSRTQSPRAFWPAGERPERLWDNRLHFPRKRGFRSYDVWLSLTEAEKRKPLTVEMAG